MSTAAEKRGLDKAAVVRRNDELCAHANSVAGIEPALQEDSNKVSDSDIEDYYKKNEGSYEQATSRGFSFRARSKLSLLPCPRPKPKAGAAPARNPQPSEKTPQPDRGAKERRVKSDDESRRQPSRPRRQG
jgi:hypothetical protein